ncbi:MAG: U32 family peptidase C-terminal domain-containing protein, partial [Eubacteriales bacterium]
RTYRKAIDYYLESEETYRKNMEWYRSEIAKCTYRQFTTGFYFGKTDETTQIYDSNTYINEYRYLGIIEQAEDGLVKIEQRNKFSVGDEIEIMKPSGENIDTKVLIMYDEDKNVIESAPHPKQLIYMKLSCEAEDYDLLRVKQEQS